MKQQALPIRKAPLLGRVKVYSARPLQAAGEHSHAMGSLQG
jgi:hypothetical protein